MNHLLTIRQACQVLNVCRNTLLAMIADGRVKAYNLKKPGGKNDIWRVDITITATDDLVLAERLKLKQIERRLNLV